MARAAGKAHELGASLRRILCISAHPDDNEFTIGGSVARWSREGRDVAFCLVTTGGAGVNEHTPSSEGLIPIREKETRAAARILGVSEVILLGYPDGTLQPTLEMRRDLTRVIRRVRPDIVVTGDPTVRFYGNEYMNHPDHRAVADAALDAIFPELLAEGLDRHKVKQVFLSGARDPDVYVDITRTLSVKCRALKAHRSQVGKGEWVDQLLKAWATRDGKKAGLRYAETFKRMVLG